MLTNYKRRQSNANVQTLPGQEALGPLNSLCQDSQSLAGTLLAEISHQTGTIKAPTWSSPTTLQGSQKVGDLQVAQQGESRDKMHVN